MHHLIKIGILFYAILFSYNVDASADPILTLYEMEDDQARLDSIRRNTLRNALIAYKAELEDHPADSVEIFKNIGLISAELNLPKDAFEYTQKYIRNSADISVLGRDSYNQIKDTDEYASLKDTYLVRVDVLTIIYFFIAIVGFFFAVIVNFKKDSDRVSNLLLGGFVTVHSLFILDFALFDSNLTFIYPHTYLMSVSVALLYGPLLYFYFKKISQRYRFKPVDALHLVPSLFLLVVLVPIYMFSPEEKIKLILGTSTLISKRDFFILGFVMKLSSYIIYGFFIGKLYFNKESQVSLVSDNVFMKWKRNIYYIHIVYIVSYAAYGMSHGIIFDYDSDFIVHSQVLAMSLMVMYISQMAYLNPKVLSIYGFDVNGIGVSNKYLKSGLTESLSEELKGELITLFTVDKVYRDSAINLDTLSEKLNTTRHNASQIINEHFDMNFFELINKFRIEEAVNLLEEDKNGNLNIIDIAYEVGYNNKVTFNKAFKKSTSLTPTQFIESIKNGDMVNRW